MVQHIPNVFLQTGNECKIKQTKTDNFAADGYRVARRVVTLVIVEAKTQAWEDLGGDHFGRPQQSSGQQLGNSGKESRSYPRLCLILVGNC